MKQRSACEDHQRINLLPYVPADARFDDLRRALKAGQDKKKGQRDSSDEEGGRQMTWWIRFIIWLAGEIYIVGYINSIATLERWGWKMERCGICGGSGNIALVTNAVMTGESVGCSNCDKGWIAS